MYATTQKEGWTGSDDGEELELRTSDGVALRATLREPAAEPRGTLVLAHAAFARRTEWERPKGSGLAGLFVRRGYRTIALDFRGHGDSGAAGPGGDGYDAYVRHDLPTVVACARDRGGPVVVVGHSLGGHVALASQGLGLLGADAIVAVAANVWHPTFEPSLLRLVAKRATATTMTALTGLVGRFPARALGIGSDDSRPSAIAAFLRTPVDGSWRSDDGRDDYLAALTRVDVPVCAVLSDGDRLACLPESGQRFVARTRGPRKVFVVHRAEGGGPPPDHMGLVTSRACRGVFASALTWLEEELERSRSRGDRVDRPDKDHDS